MAFYSYLSTKIIIAFITKSYQDLFGVRSYINAEIFNPHSTIELTQLLKIQINKLDSKDNIKLKDNLMPYSFVNMLDRALQGIVGS